MLDLFVVTAPGLELLTEREVAEITPAHLEKVTGGVLLQGTMEDLWALNQRLSTATRVLMRMGPTFKATTFMDLMKRTAKLPWGNVLLPGQPVALRVTCNKSRLHHSGAVAQRVALAVTEVLGQECAVHKPTPEGEDVGPPLQLLVLRMDHDVCTISVDSSGAALHKRGHRLATAKAPVRETLAAGLLQFVNYNGALPLCDPMCGSGTLLLEAARMQQPVKVVRHFSMLDWPCWQAPQVTLAPPPPVSSPLGDLWGNDRDEGAITATQENAARAQARVVCRVGNALEWMPPPGPAGFLVTNGPYGVRVDAGRELKPFYAALGQHWLRHWAGWRVGVLTIAPLASALGVTFERVLRVSNGGIPVVMAVATLPSRG